MSNIAPGIRDMIIGDVSLLPESGQRYKIPMFVGNTNAGYYKNNVCDNGSATGTVTPKGDPHMSADVVIQIIDSGDIGTMSYKVSYDGGQTYGDETQSASGDIALSNGITVEFGGTAFVSGDNYSFTSVGSMTPNTVYILTPQNYEEFTGKYSELYNWLTVYFNTKSNNSYAGVCLAVRPEHNQSGDVGSAVKVPTDTVIFGDIATSGTAVRNRELTIEIIKSGDCGSAEAVIYDKGLKIQDPFVLPADSSSFAIDSVLFTVSDGDTTPVLTADPTNSGDGTCDASGTQTADMNLEVVITLEGATGVAEFKYRKSEDDDWTEDVATGASVDIGDGISLAFADGVGTPTFQVGDKYVGYIRRYNFTKGDKFTCELKAPYSDNPLSALTSDNSSIRTMIKKRDEFGYFCFPFNNDVSNLNIIKALLNERELSKRSLAWYIAQLNEVTSEDSLINEDTGLFNTIEYFEDDRANLVATYHDVTIGDTTYKTPSAVFMAVKRANQEVYESPASGEEGSIEGVGKLYNEELFLKYEQEFYAKKITITHQRSGDDDGWFFSNSYLKSEENSYYDRIPKMAIIMKGLTLLRNFVLKKVEVPLKAPEGRVGLALQSLVLDAQTYIAEQMGAEINDVSIRLAQPLNEAITYLFTEKDIKLDMDIYDIPIPSTFSLKGRTLPTTS